MIKKIFLDTETTSANPMKGGLWQIAGIIECGKRKEEFVFECDIYSDDEVQQEALDLHKMTLDDLAKKEDPLKTLQYFQHMLGRYVDKYDKKDKFHLINFMAGFDATVLREWFLKGGDEFYGSWFFHPPIDVAVLAANRLMEERGSFQNFKLYSVADYLRIEYRKEDLHSALTDARIAREIYYRVALRL